MRAVSPLVQRLLAAAALIVAGALSLPLSALVLDRSTATENFIVPAQLLAMAGIGAALAAAFPAIAPAGAAPTRRLLIGCCWGVLAAGVGIAVFWLLINGIGGA